jgi:dipeptidyl aminopeptidase/acylaminoacyl peptidase
MKWRRLVPVLILLVIVLITSVVILYGKGYRVGFQTGKVELKGTGLLVAKSVPDAAQVFINGHLTTATNNTINLSPSTYEVRIFKDGYFEWKKKVIVEAEVVSRAEALLVPSAPKLENITDLGVAGPVADPSFTKLAFAVASQSAKKNGVYVIDMSVRPILTLQNALTQIADDSNNLFSTARLSWSPDGKQLLATVSGELENQTTYLLNGGDLNAEPEDVSETLDNVSATWQKLNQNNEKAMINAQSKPVRDLIKKFKILSWAPDENKILYVASESATLPVVIKPRLIGVNPTAEARDIEEGQHYVYDIKEDRNYKLDSGLFNDAYAWFPDSKHITYIKDKKVSLVEYDGLNDTVVYAGPFVDGYVFPWPDGSKIVILTNLGNSSVLPNLYTISLK